MADTVSTRLKHAWSAFRTREGPSSEPFLNQDLGPSAYSRPDRPLIRSTNERSIVTSVYNRISMDVMSVVIQHVRLNDNDQYAETIRSGLNYALTVEANVDQTSKALMQDIILSLFDEGCIAVVPTDTTINPAVSTGYDIQTLRTGRIIEWHPQHVRVRIYNEKTGNKEEITLPKSMVAIIENPLYAVMNEPNSTFKRLVRKLNILDAIDEQSGSGKLDLIIQVPYMVKNETLRTKAETRRKDIEIQLSGSKYGIAYTDGTEKVTQLNRPAENNLMTQITYLTSMLYSQLGITEDVFSGKATAEVMLNYKSRTVYPLLDAIMDEFKRKFLTKTARSQKQSLMYFANIFALIPVDKLADMADKLGRNEIMASNEFRSILGLKPSKQAGADDLRNKNLNQPTETPPEGAPSDPTGEQSGMTPDLVRTMLEE